MLLKILNMKINLSIKCILKPARKLDCKHSVLLCYFLNQNVE